MTTVRITRAPLAVQDLIAIVDGGRVELDAAVLADIAAARAVVDQALRSGAAVYGLTTQVGHAKDTRLDAGQIRGEQQFLITSHFGGMGGPLPAELVRAALAVRLNGIARGGSGASIACAETLAAMLNAGVHPLVPEIASIGAADVGQMAGIAQVAVGMGRAEYRGDVLDGGEALRRAGITPLVLSGKDGLAMMSANGVSVGQGALVAARAARAAEAADIAAALSMEAIGANVSVLHPAVARAKGVPGQVAAADHLRSLLEGSPLEEPEGARSVQDALSFRVVPQVHGALREYVAAAASAVSTELNAAADNPLAAVVEGRLISNGNFHPMVMAIAFDALRIALAHVGQLSDRRMAHLWDVFFRQLTPGPPPGPAYGLQVRYPAAARYAELRQLAGPATLDTPALDIGVEDHGTSAPLSVRLADRALDVLEDILASELLLAHDVLATAPTRARLGAGTAAALRMVEEAIAAAEPRADAVHDALRDRFPGPRRPAGG
ncbi:MAG TPA: aromatic amino acid ammonia-lyase [Streptosporangiaceae bacterium]|nr:aromatic amino acid ammonia-lyase [Streptosporangiaceae bacterium]